MATKRCPFALWVGPSGTPHDHMTPTTLTWHSDTAGGVHPAPVAPTEFHNWIAYDGTLYQHNEYDAMCDAQFEANAFAISTETASNKNATDLWTPPQAVTMRKFALWAHDTFGIALTKCATPAGGGQGYHCMWGIPGPWNHSAHTCPGPTRVKQFNEVFLPSLLTPTQPKQTEIDMPDAILMRIENQAEVYCVSAAGRWHTTPPALATLRFFALVRPGPGANGEFLVKPEDAAGLMDIIEIEPPPLPGIPTGGQLPGNYTMTGILTPKV